MSPTRSVIDRYVDRLMQNFDGGAFRIGWDAGNGAAGPALGMLLGKLPGEHHALYTERRRPLPQPSSRSDRGDESRRSQGAGRREGPRFRHRLRRRRRPDRRGGRRGPGGLGRPAARDPRRAGAAGRARRDDHRRREGEPDALRPDRRTGRQAADVEDRPQPDQVEDEGDRRAARRRDERPHLLRA